MSDILRDAVEEALTTVEQGIAHSTRPDREGFLMTSHVRQLLAAHPAEPAPVASRERVAEVLMEKAEAVDLEGGYIAVLIAPEDAADALLAAGVFREPPTAEQVREALRAPFTFDAVMALLGCDPK